MRILFCNYEYPPLGGGGGVVTALLAKELAKNHDITVLTSRGLSLPAESIERGVRVVRVPVFFRQQESVASLPSMLAFLPMGICLGRRLLKASQYDVINTHFVLPTGPVGQAMARMGNIPNVLSLHGGDLYDPSKLTSPHRNPLLRAWIRRLLRQADLVVGQSRNTLENIWRLYAQDIQALRVPLAIQRPELGAARRSDYGFQADEVLLVTVGRLVPRKGLLQLIAIMQTLRRYKVRLLIMGIGPQEQLLKAEVERLGLAKQVLFLGYVGEAEKFRILQMCDVYVSTTQHEGFGLVFLEAMASGLPIICYDAGGQTDFLCDRETGYLIPVNDIHLFEERCKQLIDDRNLRQTFGAHNKRRVEGYFIDTCAAQYEKIFDEVVRRKTADKAISCKALLNRDKESYNGMYHADSL
jgi:glycosyltransferase involved in cell wall biosynthesis